MNKAFIVAGVALLSIAFLASCKKDFNCSCTTTTKINDSVVSVTILKEQYKTTKNKAKNWCSSWSTTNIAGGNTTKTTNDCRFE